MSPPIPEKLRSTDVLRNALLNLDLRAVIQQIQHRFRHRFAGGFFYDFTVQRKLAPVVFPETGIPVRPVRRAYPVGLKIQNDDAFPVPERENRPRGAPERENRPRGARGARWEK